MTNEEFLKAIADPKTRTALLESRKKERVRNTLKDPVFDSLVNFVPNLRRNKNYAEIVKSYWTVIRIENDLDGSLDAMSAILERVRAANSSLPESFWKSLEQSDDDAAIDDALEEMRGF